MIFSKLGQVLKAVGRAGAMRQRECWSRDQLEAFQSAQLTALVHHVAARSAFYRRHWGLSPGDTVSLAQLPPVRRTTLMEHFDDAVTDRRLRRDAIDACLATVTGDPKLPGGFRAMSSSGSSGERGRFVYDADGWTTFLAGVLRWTRWMGVRPKLPRMRTAAIGAPDAKHMTFRGAASLDVGMFHALRLSATEPLDSLVEALNHHQPDFVNAYPSIAALLAEEQLAGRLRIAPRALCTSSEQRTADVTARLQRAFEVTPFDCYALTETGITAVDCERHEGLHVFEDLCLVEVIDDQGNAVPPGTIGARVLMTNLYNRALPMIRVEVSDLLVELPGACACGRRFKRLAAVEGRADDVLTLTSIEGQAVKVHPIHLRSKLVACAELVQYRVTVRPGGLELEAVLGGDAGSAASMSVLTHAVAEFFRSQGLRPLPVTIRPVAAIERDNGVGKLKVVRQFAV